MKLEIIYILDKNTQGENQKMEKINMDQEINNLICHMDEAEQEIFRNNFENVIEDIRNCAFMEGYRYAIEVLKESMVKGKE